MKKRRCQKRRFFCAFRLCPLGLLLVVVLEEEVVIGEAGDVDLLYALVEQRLERLNVGALFGLDEEAIARHLVHPGVFQLVEGDVLACAGREVVSLLRYEGEGIHFVKHQDHGLLAIVDLS